MPEETDWEFELLDGQKVTEYGKLTVNDGVVWVTDRSMYGGHINSQVAYPLTSVRKWVRSATP